MRHIEPDLLGPDLIALIDEVATPLIEAEVITGLPAAGSSRASFRLAFKDGVTVKGRRFDNADIAERVRALSGLLAADDFSRVLAWRGCATIEEWVDGKVDDTICRQPRLLRFLGARLGKVHATILPPQVEQRYGQGRQTARALRDPLERLSAELFEMGNLTQVQHEFVRKIARTKCPTSISCGLLHGDYAPENIVINENGYPVVVDNGSIRVGMLALDLARVWYRWPLDGQSEAHFLDGYASASDCADYGNNREFWRVFALAEAAHFRAYWQTENSELPLTKLHAILTTMEARENGGQQRIRAQRRAN
ncbi:MAG: aminoglycoside phosphotransferase family protein [Alphaproteobacteria bacterium]|nr:aminoglycoside phosphotransferase family protein [Alphaproteobacteria bacterium]